MTRPPFGLFVALGLCACGPRAQPGTSQCDQDPPPPACRVTCDPLPGSPPVCPAGWHCAPDGVCDSVCTPGGDACGAGYVCTADGRCVDDGTVDPVGPDAACPDVIFTPTPQTPSIGLVLDQSGSMLFGLIDDDVTMIDKATCATNPRCRFTAMRAALTGPTGVVTQLQSKAYFGHNQYTCDKEFQPTGDTSVLQLFTTGRALDNAAAIDAQLALTSPANSWNTPTFAAIDAMVASFVADPPAADSPPAIILATDGLPTNCGTGAGYGAATQAARQDLVIAAAERAYATAVGGHPHIPVYVLAMNIDSPHFQELANVGQGAPRSTTGVGAIPYYPVTGAAQLQAAFQTVINGVLSCDLALTGTIDMAQAQNGTFTINGQPQQYGTDWTLVSGSTIRVLGAACTTLQSLPSSVVQAAFPCGSVVF